MEGRRSRRKWSSSQLSGSESGSGRQSLSTHSSSQLRLRGSRSFLGSQSSLASLSRRNLASESSRFHKPDTQILDENGEDVTPRPLLGLELLKKISNKTFWNETVSSDHVFHHSGTSGSNLSQPFSASVVMEGGSTLESNMSLSLVGSGIAQSPVEPQEPGVVSETGENGEVQEVQESVCVEGEEDVTITLSETDTICLLDIPGSVVTDPSQQRAVQEGNQVYQELLKSRRGNDRYSERGMQTIDNARKTKHVQTDPINTTSNGAFVSSTEMFDTYLASKSAEETKELDSDASLDELASRAASRLATTALPPSQPPPDSSTAIPGESTLVASVFTDQPGSFGPLVRVTSSRGISNQTGAFDPTKPNDHPVLEAEGLPERLRVVETAVILNNMQNRQALYRDLPTLIEHVPSTVESLVISRPHLDRLWAYSFPLTSHRTVTALTWNPSNPDILAVGYSSCTGSDPGLVCCWSLKNSEFPARIFQAPSRVTSLGFSSAHPNLLAAGLSNGSLLLYNVRNTQHSPVLDSRDAPQRHCGPVWQVQWVLKDKTLGEEAYSEALISTSSDGRVLLWSIRKGLESSILMKLKRVTLPKPLPVKKQTKTGKKGAAQPPPPATVISQHAPGLGLDFNPANPTIYLVCTEEGLIHKCSCSYNEQFLETYKGHTGAVYRVRWSPFLSDVFLSCGADWTVRLWHEEHTSPLLTFSNTKTPVYDVVWSPFHSAMFGCVSGAAVEIWNLETNILDPVINHHSLHSSPTSLSFSTNSHALLVGVASGKVGVYQMKNIPLTAEKEALLAVVEMALHS